jgi:predicted nucleic acid-binding Zn ribbon protein
MSSEPRARGRRDATVKVKAPPPESAKAQSTASAKVRRAASVEAGSPGPVDTMPPDLVDTDPPAPAGAGRPAEGEADAPASPPGTAPHPAMKPDQVARAALSRAQEAARSRGLRPGDNPRRPRSIPGPVSSAGPDARDPQPLGVAAGRLATELGWRPGLVEGDLRGRWAELVGADIAEHCRPDTFDAGLLTLRASSTAWAASLTLLAPQLLRRLGEDLGEGVVVEVKVLAPVGRGFGRGKRSVPGRGPRDTWG